jgi:hypothetical protein
MKQRLFYLAILVIAPLLVSCSDDGEGKSGSRDVTFEVTGNFSGQISTTFITASGGGTNESINGLPWTKVIRYEKSVPSTAISVIGAGGETGETLTVKVVAGGNQVSSTPGSADNDGTVVITAPSYIF